MKSSLQVNENNYADEKKTLNSPPADISRLLNLLGGKKELLKNLINMLMDAYPEKLERLKKAASDNNAYEFEKTAHSLKGSIGNFGAKQAFDLAFKLENMGREGQLNGADEIINELQEEMKKLRSFFRNMC